MRKIDLKKQMKRDSLLDSGLFLFTEKGFNETSIADIVKHAGVAKGTFYLYFTDKLDLRNKLIAHQASRVFMNAYHDLDQKKISVFEDQVVFLADHILNQFTNDKKLVFFISKHLSWAIFRESLHSEAHTRGEQTVLGAFLKLLEASPVKYKDPERMIYMILEFTSGASYNAILYNEPTDLNSLKEDIFDIIRYITRKYQLPA